MKRKGFTLIELMIVVAIIGILAAVAIPKFANLIRKSKEAACKGSLGAIRSAVSIYYGDQEGMYPQKLDGNGFTPTYMSAIPTAKTGDGTTPDSNAVEVETDGSSIASLSGATGGWWYNSAETNSSGEFAGEVKVNTTETDTKGSYIHTW